MSFAAPYPDILQQEGFQLIGQLDYRLHLTAWWNPAADKRVQVLVVNVGGSALLKGEKSYFLKSIGAEGETWARDIAALHDYLENHFPEIRVSFSHFRDVPPALAEAEVRRRLGADAPSQALPSVEQIAQVQQQLQGKQHDAQATESLLALSTMPSDLLTGYAHQQGRSMQSEIKDLETHLQRERERLSLLRHLQREYERKGSAAVYGFAISSNLQVAENAPRFRDALRAVVKELMDQHRYQVTQKLQGGRLNILVAETEEPVLAWIEQWLGGALSPTQTQRLSPAFDALRTAAADHMIVTPDEPIVADGHVRQAEKHLAARFLSTVLHRLDKTDARGQKGALDPETTPSTAMPLRVGLRTDETGRTLGPAVIPLTQIVHAYISGTTGSGKSFLARALVEEAAQHKELSVLVLDPRNQFVGLLVPEDRPQILQQYGEFAMNSGQARGFAFRYFAPALASTSPLPGNLSSLAAGRSIVSFKGMDDQQRCLLAGRILEAAFQSISAAESERPRLLIVVDEAQLLTRKRVDESAKDAAAQAERALDKIAREGRKYGMVLILVSQTIKDFSYELASLRQMTNTKIFLRNSDREIEYAADFVGDGRLLVQLPTGTALVHNANWGLHRIRVRPPYSKVYELREAEIRQLVGNGLDRVQTLTGEARRLFAVIKQHGPTPDSPLNLSQAAELAGITSKRRLQELIGELEQSGAICTRQLPERGRPRVIELREQSSEVANAAADKSRTKADSNGGSGDARVGSGIPLP
jgi:hypothetical protein